MPWDWVPLTSLWTPPATPSPGAWEQTEGTVFWSSTETHIWGSRGLSRNSTGRSLPLKMPSPRPGAPDERRKGFANSQISHFEFQFCFKNILWKTSEITYGVWCSRWNGCLCSAPCVSSPAFHTPALFTRTEAGVCAARRVTTSQRSERKGKEPRVRLFSPPLTT